MKENLEELSNAFTEVIEVLKYIPKEEYDKIPKKFLNLLKCNCNEKYVFKYNTAMPFEKQEISNDAKVLLELLCKTCWKKDNL